MRRFAPYSLLCRRPPLVLLAAVFLLSIGCARTTVGGVRSEYRPQAAALPERPPWIDRIPADADGYHFLVGLSDYHASERDAREDAMRNAREQYAAYTGVDVALVDTIVRSLHGTAGEVHDPFVAAVESSTQSTDAQVSRIKARQWYWETYAHYRGGEMLGSAWKCWVLVAVPVDEYDRVQVWKQEREAGRRAEEARRARAIEEFARAPAGDTEEKVAAVLLPARPLGEFATAASLRELLPQLDAHLADSLRRMLPFPLTVAAAPAGDWRPLTAAERERLRAGGARFALAPRIDAYADRTTTREFAKIGRVAHERKVALAAAVEVIDLASGDVLPAAAAPPLERSESSGMVAPGTPARLPGVVVEAAKEMASALARSAAVAVGPPRILAVTGDQILIDRGTDFGFRVGETVAVYAARSARAGSGQAFSEELPVGTARIVRGDDSRAYATLLPPVVAVRPGFVVRPLAENGGAPVAAEAAEAESPGSSARPVNWNVNLQ